PEYPSHVPPSPVGEAHGRGAGGEGHPAANCHVPTNLVKDAKAQSLVSAKKFWDAPHGFGKRGFDKLSQRQRRGGGG
ncbi:hypothetical protein, partial [Candidatus Oscillochloris fontis]|uniref:hypothetical protein n=1 Tax=Candidatus Oscillochloris fontis TaxID=2496868 RepID=UPI001EE99DC9